MKNLALLIVCVICFSNCNREFYKTASYEEKAASHQIVAVLPVETITTGRVPERISEEHIRKIENAESRAFQTSLYNELAKRSGRYRGTISLDIQHFSETNAKLDAAGINPRGSWRMSAIDLAKILGVDAVIRTSVQKDRYLTDLESFGVTLANTILLNVTNGASWLFPGNRTSNLFISCSVLNGADGIPVWVSNVDCPTNWNRRSYEVIDDVSRMIGRRFPYRD